MYAHALAGLGSLLVLGCTCSGEVVDRTHATPSPGAGGSTSFRDATAADATLPDAPSDAADASDGAFGPHGGSRLWIDAWSYAGAATPRGGFAVTDSKTGHSCFVERTEDGVIRCLPEGIGVVYTQADCTGPIGSYVDQKDDCFPTAPHQYAVGAVSSTQCAPIPVPMRVYTVGAAVPTPSHVYVQGPFGCSEDTIGEGRHFVEITPSPSDEWVALEPQVVRVTDRLGIRYLRGSDGSRLFDTILLLPDEMPCRETTADGVTVRCLPSYEHFAGSYFSDPTCTGPVAATFSCEPVGLIYAVTDAGAVPPATATHVPACEPASTTLAPLFRAISDDSAYTTFGAPTSGCIPAGGFHFYSRGDRVSFDSFPELRFAHEGGERLHPVYLEGEGRRLSIVPDVLYDTALSSYCTPNSSGQCIPDDLAGGGLYGDPKCTVPLAKGASPCRVPVVFQGAPDSPDGSSPTCATSPTWYSLGAAHPGPTYADNGFGCVAISPAGPVFEIGNRVDPNVVFATMTAGSL